MLKIFSQNVSPMQPRLILTTFWNECLRTVISTNTATEKKIKLQPPSHSSFVLTQDFPLPCCKQTED